MASTVDPPFPASYYEKEYIPDDDTLFRRAPKNQLVPLGELTLVVFSDRDGYLSTDWNKYSTPEATRQRVRHLGRNPDSYAVAALPVGRVRHEAGQEVEHSPQDDNQAHTDVIGNTKRTINDIEVRVLLLRMATLVLPYVEQPDHEDKAG
jgi:hypothetical protein